MAVVTVLTMIEDEFGITVDDDEVSADVFETLGTLAASSTRRSPLDRSAGRPTLPRRRRRARLPLLRHQRRAGASCACWSRRSPRK